MTDSLKPSPADGAARRRGTVVARWPEMVSVCLLVVMAANLLSVIVRKSITNDEVVMIPAAFYHLAVGEFGVIRSHPPLYRIFAGFPLLFLQLNALSPEHIDPTATEAQRASTYQARFWQDNQSRFHAVSLWARVPMVALTLLLGALIFLVARRLFGARAAAFAVALFALEPTVLAHGRVVQTDIAAAFGYLLSCSAVAVYLHAPTWRRALWLGAAVGVALLTKFSMLVILPGLTVVLIVQLARAATPARRAATAGHAAVAAVAALALVHAGYHFHFRAPTDADHASIAAVLPAAPPERLVTALSYLVPIDFILGVTEKIAHGRDGHPASLLGMYSHHGWWYYFPIAFALKTTLPFLLLSLAALVWGTRRWVQTRDTGCALLLVGFGAYTVFLLWSPINIGVRYYLPAYPFLFILGGGLLDAGLAAPRWRAAARASVAAMLAWIGIETVGAYPDYMSYMNRLTSARPRWYYLSDSNVEWGDDVPALAAYLHRQGERRVRAALLAGYMSLGYYGIEYVNLLSPAPGAPPATRYVALGASFLNGSTVPGHPIHGVTLSEPQRVDLFSAYRDREPEAVFGNSIYLFREPDES